MNEIVARNVVDNIVNVAECAAYFAARACVEDGEVGGVYAKASYSVYDDHATGTRRRFHVTVKVEEVPVE